MPSTRQTFVHYNKLRGMSRAARPFLLPPEQWYTDFNMRTFSGELRQVPLKKVRQYTIPYSGRTTLALCNIPNPSGTVLIGLTEDKVKRIERNNATALKEAGVELTLHMPSVYTRYGTCVFNNRLFFVNPQNTVRYTDGSSVTPLGGTAPAGRYVEVWFDHVVVGGPIFPGEDFWQGVAWSNLNEWGNFTPDTHSEADRYVCTEYQRDSEVVPGITGVKKLGNVCYIYTASCIYMMRYVGLPRVVRVDPANEFFGNGFQYGLASAKQAHYFFDWTSKNFYVFNGAQCKAIGDDIRTYFVRTLNTDPELRQRTWAYVDKEFTEIWWVYVSSGSSGEFDRAVVYDYEDGSWFAASVEDVHCFTNSVEQGAKTFDQLTGTIDQQTVTMDQWGGASGMPLRLWGGANERLLEEEKTSDATTDLLAQELPVLESGDQVYGGVQHVKEVDNIAVQSGMSGPPLLEVELSKRDNVDDAVVFDKVGLWSPEKKPVLDLQKTSGRVFRWRFHPLERQTSDVLVFKTGVADFTLRTEMSSTVDPGTGGGTEGKFYLSFGATNPSVSCSSVVQAITVNATASLDSAPVVFEATYTNTPGSVPSEGRRLLATIHFDQAFLDLPTGSPGPELSGIALSITHQVYNLVDGLCTAAGITTREISYADLIIALLALSNAGTTLDPFVFDFSTS